MCAWTFGRSEGSIGSTRTGVAICGCCDLNPHSLWKHLVFSPALQFLMYFLLFMYISFMDDFITVWTCKYIVSFIRFTSSITKSYCSSPRFSLPSLNQYRFYCHTFVLSPEFQTWEKSRACYCETAVFLFKWLSPVPPSLLEMGSICPFCEQINFIAYFTTLSLSSHPWWALQLIWWLGFGRKGSNKRDYEAISLLR